MLHAARHRIQRCNRQDLNLRVNSITNNLNASRSQSFSYDHLNRILTAGTTATTGTYCWGYQYNYDAWGNLLAQAGWSPNYNGCSEATMGSVIADGNNHISGFTYDASGNTQNDGSIAYTYDAESQITSAAGVTYLYDGSGRRVSKSNGKLYWYGSGGEILAETNASGATLNEYIFFAGKRVAMLPATGNPEYYAEDFLGSSRVMTTNTGTVCYDADFDPYGGEHPYTNGCPSATPYKFEGKERDTETGNDEFGARYYTSRFGRWLSADWSAVPVAVPYANLTNPQTLNLYAMVADDPESFADLDGHCNANDWCGSVGGVAIGTLKFVGHAVEAAVVSSIPVYGSMKAGESITNSVATAAQDYYNKGISGVANQLLDQGREGATEIVTEAVLTGGLGASGRVDGVTPESWGAPDSNVIVRGGQSEMPTPGTKFSGSQGATVEDAAQGVPHGTIRESTAGQIRKAGGSVRSKPELTNKGNMNPKHVNVREAANKPSTFSAPKPNPVPKKERIE